MVRVWFAVVMLALAAAVSTAAGVGGAPAGAPGKIAFASDRTGTFELYVADPAGAGARRVTSGGGFGPLWSPDGGTLAFVRVEETGRDAGRSVVWVVAEDGAGLRRLGVGTDPAWSPDGSRLALARSGEIVVVAADGSGERRLTRASRADVGTFAGLPAWSPDGAHVAYATLNGFYAVAADGTGLRQLTSWGADLDSWARPVWSPGGDAIALVTSTCCARGDATQSEWQTRSPALEVQRWADGRVTRLAAGIGDVVAWSPDGTRLAYSRPPARDDPDELYVARADGSGSVRLTRAAVGERSTQPAWSPDGRWLAYVRDRYPQRLWSASADVAVVRADGVSGYALTRVYPSGGTNGAPAWAPGAAPAAAAVASTAATPVPLTRRTATASYGELAASGRRAAVFSSDSALPLFWTPAARAPTRSRAADLACNDAYGLVLARDHAAWLCAFAHGVVSPVTDVTLVLTHAVTGRSAAVRGSAVERPGHHPPYDGGPRVAADGPVVVYNPDGRGSVLFRVVTSGARPALRRIAAAVAVADVDGQRIAGWRGDRTAVVVRTDGRLLATVPLERRATAGLELDRGRLVAVVGGRVWTHDLATGAERSWPTVDAGGAPPRLAGVEGDLAVYVSGVAVHVLRLSSGRDVTLALPNQGPWIDVELTADGLFGSYDAPYVRHPGRLVFAPLAGIAAAV
jgi:TolB protein